MPKKAAQVDRIIRDVGEAVTALSESRSLALDLETSGLSPWRDRVAVVTLRDNETGVTAVLHIRGEWPEALVNFLSQPRTYIVHNGVGFDIHCLATAGVDVEVPTWYDTLVGETAVVQTNRRDVRVNLQASLRRRLGKEILKEADHGSWMNPELGEEQMVYVTDDVRYLHDLHDAQWAKAAETGCEDALRLEMAIMPVVVRMTQNGTPFDLDALTRYFETLQVRKGVAGARLLERFGTLNWRSPLQVRKAFLSMGVDIAKTDKDTFRAMAEGEGEWGAVARDVLDYKYADQRMKMYGQAWIDQYVYQHHDREFKYWAHPRFWQCSTNTTRFSSSDPNFQQIPRDMRHVVGGVPGYKVVSGDYSQIEVVIAAYLANDQDMLAAMHAGHDIHTYVASQLFKVPIDQVADQQRKVSKAGNFTLLFCGGHKTLWARARLDGASITLKGAEQVKAAYLQRFRGIAAMRARAEMTANRRGAVVLKYPTGHRRVLTGADLRSTTIVNNTVQGTAAGGLKFGLLAMKKSGTWRDLMLTVHDENVALVKEGEAQEYAEQMEKDMLAGMHRIMPGAPVKVKMTIGDRWS